MEDDTTGNSITTEYELFCAYSDTGYSVPLTLKIVPVSTTSSLANSITGDVLTPENAIKITSVSISTQGAIDTGYGIALDTSSGDTNAAGETYIVNSIFTITAPVVLNESFSFTANASYKYAETDVLLTLKVTVRIVEPCAVCKNSTVGLGVHDTCVGCGITCDGITAHESCALCGACTGAGLVHAACLDCGAVCTGAGLVHALTCPSVYRGPSSFDDSPTPTHTIFFDDGMGGIVQLALPTGRLIPQPPLPVRPGYSFLGWYRDVGLTRRWNFDSERVGGDITLYAGWLEELLEPPKTGSARNIRPLFLLAWAVMLTIAAKVRRQQKR